jgi:hypothetical protein
MKAIEFCYWLRGYFELTGADATALTEEQSTMISDHLKLVFTQVTGDPDVSKPGDIQTDEMRSTELYDLTQPMSDKYFEPFKPFETQEWPPFKPALGPFNPDGLPTIYC